MLKPNYLNKNISFSQAINIWGSWGKYLQSRFHSRSFISAIPVINSLKKVIGVKPHILDICCGAGHFAYTFKNKFPEAKIFCCDQAFINLYFLKNYFNKNVIAICCDCNHKLPLKNNSFDLVFNSDSFHYLDDKETCANDIFRLLKNKGVLIISHLHNKLIKNKGQGDALTYQEYCRFFDKLKLKIYSERRVFMDFLLKNNLDFNSSDLETVLNKSNAFIIVGRK